LQPGAVEGIDGATRFAGDPVIIGEGGFKRGRQQPRTKDVADAAQRPKAEDQEGKEDSEDQCV
jgi:hypothetical protein